MTPATTEQAATDAPRFDIRPASAESLAYVLSTWGRTLEAHLEAVPQPGFLKAFAPIQARIIKRSQVLTAMHGERIAAFIVYEPGSWGTITNVDREAKSITIGGPVTRSVLHWISTRKEHRQQGAASELLQHAGIATKAELLAAVSGRALQSLSDSKPTITAWTSDLRHLGLADAPYTPFWLRPQ